MLFMYFLDATNPDFHRLSVRIFEQLMSQKAALYTSIISVLETLSFPKLYHLPDKVESYHLFFKTCRGLTIEPVDEPVSLAAAGLRRRHPSLKTPDSIQLATAIIHQAGCFITNDDRLKNITPLPFPILTLKSLAFKN